MTYLVLDLETIPDAARWSGSADVFPPTWAHRIVCAGFVHLANDYRLLAMGTIDERDGLGNDPRPERLEHLLLDELSYRIATAKPTLVTFNGRSFDLPVIVARSMLYGVDLRWYFASRDMRYRYSEVGHLDLCDALSDHGAAKMVTLDAWARLIGLPGKANGDGSQVAELYATEQLEAIANYCLADVAQTALLLLRYRQIQGQIDNRTWAEQAGALLKAFCSDPRLAPVFCPGRDAAREEMRSAS